jgi:glycosyltransferase involved in cell wall biosynthesis
MLNFFIVLYKPFLKKFTHISRMQNMPSMKKLYLSRRKYFFWGGGVRFADIIIAQTEEMKGEAVKLLNVDENKIIVQHNPLDTDYIDCKLENASSPYQHTGIIGLASGRMDKGKAFDILIRALPAVIKEYPDFFLHIIGRDGGEQEGLLYLSKELSIEKHIIFLGRKDNPYIYYKYCDLYIMSSRIEGFPNTLLENYYLNTPTAAARCVPIVEKFIKNGENGFLSEVDDPASLSVAIINTIKIKREDIHNPPYHGGNIMEILGSVHT